MAYLANAIEKLEIEVSKIKLEKQVKVYKKEWHEPVYEDVLVSPEHYQKIEINPYLGTQKIVEDNIPIK